ncbi:response regulator [Hyphomonas sp.]|uniref:response regulator n=1 Tax=Hyphomonas sp. TaxID=87 RepID=UPI00391D56EE
MSPEPAQERAPRRVVVVDDSPAVRQSLSLLLTSRGYVVEALSGADELLLDVRPGDFDVFVIDLKMDGMDGVDLLAALRRRGISEPAVLISGWYLPALETAALRAGFAALVRKPMMDVSLVSVIDYLLAQP